jgi:hypothetical protein
MSRPVRRVIVTRTPVTKYQAEARLNCVIYNLGVYDTKEEADAAEQAFRKEHEEDWFYDPRLELWFQIKNGSRKYDQEAVRKRKLARKRDYQAEYRRRKSNGTHRYGPPSSQPRGSRSRSS